jgi:hypothetical protein
MRRLATALLACTLLAAPAGAAAQEPVGRNAQLVTQLPEAAGAIAMEFSEDSPLLVVSTLKGIHTYDVSDPAAPKPLGFLPMLIWQNEDMSLVERGKKEKYALVASNGAVAGLRDTTLDTDTGGTAGRKLFVVDVSDPASPRLISSVATPTRTHTVSCATRECPFAYSDGRAGGAMSIVDLRDPRKPVVAGTYKSVVPSGHDQDGDDAGILWHVGGEGGVALDVSDPVNPVALNSTDRSGLASSDFSGRPWNNFILHNSFRPNARDFRADRPPALRDGNVLLVTEEDYLNDGAPQCGDYEGSFQTWHVPFLDAERYRQVNPEGRQGGGTIRPLDRWNTELLDSGETPAGAFCSAHYFDYLDDGFVAQGWYQQGTRILDVRDPTDIKQVGYWFTGAMETWAAYWVPNRLAKKDTLVYTADAVRGIDVLRVTLPKGGPDRTEAVRAPILRSWIARSPGLERRRSADWGFACPLPLRGIG